MAAEKRILTEEMIEQGLEAAKSREVRWIDPYKMAAWTIDFAIEMVCGAVGKTTIQRAITEGTLPAYKPGKEVCVVPSDFITWVKRAKQ